MAHGTSPAHESVTRAARAADNALRAAVGALHHGADPRALAQAGEAAGRAAGGDPVRVEVRVGARPATSPLAKASLVRLRARGAVGGTAFGLARTAVVGFDTLPEQAALGAGALRALAAAVGEARPGVTAGALGRQLASILREAGMEIAPPEAEAWPCGAPAVAGPRPVPADRPLADGEVLYVGLGAAAGLEVVEVGDLVRVGPDGGEMVTRTARRLWL